jgi:hypothetical protein
LPAQLPRFAQHSIITSAYRGAQRPLAFALWLGFDIDLRTLHYTLVFKQLDSNFFLEFFMKYRDIEYAVVQEVDRGTWRWTVNLIDGTAESGLRKTREGALTAVVLTIDRWIARKGIQFRWPVRHNVRARGDSGLRQS